MSINKPDPEILKAFWWDLSEDVRHQIVKKHHQEYNNFLNGELTKPFNKQLKNLIELDILFMHGAQQGLVNVVKACAELGVDIHQKEDSALRYAATNGHFEAIKYFLDNGADIHANNDEALRLASAKG